MAKIVTAAWPSMLRAYTNGRHRSAALTATGAFEYTPQHATEQVSVRAERPMAASHATFVAHWQSHPSGETEAFCHRTPSDLRIARVPAAVGARGGSARSGAARGSHAGPRLQVLDGESPRSALQRLQSQENIDDAAFWHAYSRVSTLTTCWEHSTAESW